MIRRAIVLALVAAVSVAGGVQAAAAPPTAGALLDAGIPWSTVLKVGGPAWWPGVPQFEAPPLFRQPMPKKPLNVTSQWYVKPGTDISIQTTLFSFPGSGEPHVCAQLGAADGVPIDIGAPAVGANHAFWVAGDPSAPVTILCFERGPVAVEIKVIGERWGAARIGLLAKPVDANVQALLAGKLVRGYAAELLDVLPLRGDAPGRELGATVLPPTAWASAAANPTPEQVLAQLKRGGSTSLPFRRYLLGDGVNVIDVTLFPFRTDAAAAGWFATLKRASSVASTDIPVPGTGKQSLLRELDEYYVLDFVAGHAVADATCYAPYGEKPTPGCIAALRKLGARWHAQLARG